MDILLNNNVLIDFVHEATFEEVLIAKFQRFSDQFIFHDYFGIDSEEWQLEDYREKNVFSPNDHQEVSTSVTMDMIQVMVSTLELRIDFSHDHQFFERLGLRGMQDATK